MTEKKLTKVEKIEMLLNMAEVKANAVAVEFLEHEKELLQNKVANKKATKTQEENTVIKAEILEYLKANGERKTITALIKDMGKMGEWSTQKVTALMKHLIAEGLVEKEVEKKVSYFKAVKTEQSDNSCQQ